MKTQTAALATTTEVAPVQPAVIGREQAEASLKRLMLALYSATGDAATAVGVIDKLSDGIEADPELSRKMFTPENIEKVMQLQHKSKTGKIKVDDLLQAFPVVGELIPAPLLSMLKTFMK